MVRLGSAPSDMRNLEPADLFVTRLQLLIMMAAAYLKEYPLGEHRIQAVINNAHQVAKDSVDWNGRIANFRSEHKTRGEMDYDHVFFQRVKLLTVMAKSFAEGNPMGHFRCKSLEDNIQKISEAIAFSSSLKGMNFLKVA